MIGFYNMQRNNIINAAILAGAFLNNSDDARNPPSEPYRDMLLEAGCDVMVHDPHVLEYSGVSIMHELDDVVDADGFIGGGFVYKGIGRGDKNGHEMG